MKLLFSLKSFFQLVLFFPFISFPSFIKNFFMEEKFRMWNKKAAIKYAKTLCTVYSLHTVVTCYPSPGVAELVLSGIFWRTA